MQAFLDRSLAAQRPVLRLRCSTGTVIIEDLDRHTLLVVVVDDAAPAGETVKHVRVGKRTADLIPLVAAMVGAADRRLTTRTR